MNAEQESLSREIGTCQQAIDRIEALAPEHKFVMRLELARLRDVHRALTQRIEDAGQTEATT